MIYVSNEANANEFFCWVIDSEEKAERSRQFLDKKYIGLNMKSMIRFYHN